MRKTKAKRAEVLPDPKFSDRLVTRFVNNLMYDGKKNVAFNIFYDALDIVSEKTKENGLEVFKKSLENVSPSVEVRSRRIGGATFQIPTEIRPARKLSLGMKSLISYARSRKEKSMANNLASEIIAAFKEEGGSFKKKEDIHRMADANKAFSHFRF